MGFEWTELTYQQIEAGKDLLTKLVFPLAVLFVFLVLAAQYESWSLPLAIILIVPMCLLAAIAGVWLMRLDNNIFTQIGLVVLVGLAAKNAILIVEFAKQREDEGLDRIDATVEACQMRLRPILMTSFAFILGVVPLVLAKGAGAEMRVGAGRRGVQRHARRDVLRHLLHAGLLRGHPLVVRDQGRGGPGRQFLRPRIPGRRCRNRRWKKGSHPECCDNPSRNRGPLGMNHRVSRQDRSSHARQRSH